MRLFTFVLLLLAVYAFAVQAGTSRTLLQSSAECPIEHCNNNGCAYNSRKQSWLCSSCQSPFVVNRAKSACVCPAGQYPVIGSNRCALCPKGYFCPRGDIAGRSTAKPCPKNMDTLAPGAKSVTDCVNKPGYFLVRTATGVRPEPCPIDTYSPGLAKQTECTRCLSGFSTDPDLVPGSQTSSKVCLAKPGYFIAGDSTAPCPQGEYNDKYDMAGSCTPCSSHFDEEYSVGITTAATGSTSVNDCKVAEPGYVLVNEKKTAILSAPASDSGYKLGGAKLCPQKYFCPGGNVEQNISAATSEAGTPLVAAEVGMLAPQGRVQLWTTGIPVRCPGGTWTEEEGAKTIDECVAPPGSYISAGNSTTPIAATKCPSGTYKEEWDRAPGCKSCENPAVISTSSPASTWLSDETTYINDIDPTTGLVNRQVATRGSPDSCFIQKGMGTLIVSSTSGSVTLKAQVCPANSYGIDAAKKYGRISTPCTPCPVNMGTLAANGTASVQITSYVGNDGLIKSVTSDQGYFSIGACRTLPGHGYYNGNAQKCPKGTYNPGNNQMPCTVCPVGVTTNFASNNIALTDCNLYMAGYGTVNGIVQQCPLGSYQVQDTAVGGGAACQSCADNSWTPTTGAVALNQTTNGTSCSLCAAGYGDDTWYPARTYAEGSGPACVSCQDGLYGDLTRADPKCQVCPIERVFSYAYTGTQDVVKPQATSPVAAKSISECVTDFQQIVDGAFHIKFGSGSMYNSRMRMENIQSCVEECRNTWGCAAITFDYDPDNRGEPCQLFKPAGAEGNTSAASGIAWKTMPSSVYAQRVGTKAMGSGLYAYYWGVADTVFEASAKATADEVTTLADCLGGCNNRNLCAGIAYTGFDSDSDAVSSCTYIMGTVEPGSSLRSLTKTMYQRLQAVSHQVETSPDAGPASRTLPYGAVATVMIRTTETACSATTFSALVAAVRSTMEGAATAGDVITMEQKECGVVREGNRAVYMISATQYSSNKNMLNELKYSTLAGVGISEATAQALEDLLLSPNHEMSYDVYNPSSKPEFPYSAMAVIKIATAEWTCAESTLGALQGATRTRVENAAQAGDEVDVISLGCSVPYGSAVYEYVVEQGSSDQNLRDNLENALATYLYPAAITDALRGLVEPTDVTIDVHVSVM